MTYSLWTDTTLTSAQRNLLSQIEDKASQLRDKLDAVRMEAEGALDRMDRGQNAAWGSDLFGQSVRDAERLNTELQCLVNVARGFVDVEKIQAAYNA